LTDLLASKIGHGFKKDAIDRFCKNILKIGVNNLSYTQVMDCVEVISSQIISIISGT
jgi:hypothetical protein